MIKEFVKYEQALSLKELGFDEKCLAYWFNETPLNPEGQCLVYYRKPYDNVGITNGIIREYGWAPTYSQSFRWFREKYKLYPEIGLHDREDEKTWRFTISILGYYELAYNQNVGKEPYYKTYEEAESACLDKLVEIIKNK